MSITFNYDESFPTEQALTVIKQRLTHVSESLARSSDQQIVRIEVRLDDNIDPLAWVAAQSNTPSCYWGDRDQGFVMGGVGQVWRVPASDPLQISDQQSVLKRAKIFGDHPPPIIWWNAVFNGP